MDFFVLPLSHGLRHLSPNQVTLVGFLLAVLASALILKSSAETVSNNYLVFAGVLVFAHGLLDMLDGVIARRYDKATPLGDFFDHVADRVSDVLLLSAVAFSPWGDIRVGLWAIVAALMTSYLGTQAQAVGAGRMYTGFVARADRLVLLMVAPVVDHALAGQGVQLAWVPGAPHALGLVLWYIAIGGTITAAERFVRIARSLSKRSKSEQKT